MTLRVRDLDPEWVQAQRSDAAEIAMWADDLSKIRHLEMLAALAAAIPALKEHEGLCPVCWDGENGWSLGCSSCDGTGANPARRALDIVIGEGK